MYSLNKENTFVISDNHFFHSNIIKYCGRPYNIVGKCNFDPVDMDEIKRMNEDMLKQYDTLPEECDVWNLGDIFFAGKTHAEKFTQPEMYIELKKITARITNNGKRRVYLVLGNHDTLHFKDDSIINFYLSLGFTGVFNTPVLIDHYILSHEPVYISKGSNLVNLYGHTHDLNIKEDYFTYDYDNYAMETRVAKQKGIEPPEIKQVWPDRMVSLSNYVNCCLDKNHNFIKFSELEV